jgi:hypothetical protein
MHIILYFISHTLSHYTMQNLSLSLLRRKPVKVCVYV